MLEINLPAITDWNEETEEWTTIPALKLQMEHSLLSISKWESKWHVPFLYTSDKTNEQMLDYIHCMIINKNVSPQTLYRLTPEDFKTIDAYILNPMSATTINDRDKSKANKKILTSERIYYYMTAAQIPFECERWHLNRLIKLIQICAIESEPPKKMSKREIASQYASLNEQRRKAMNSRG